MSGRQIVISPKGNEEPMRKANPPQPVPAVAAIIVQGGKLLLVKRAVEPSKGKWSVPGGGVEWGEPLVEAVKREVREETGLEIEVEKVAGVYDLITEGEGGVAYHYVIIDYFAHPIGGTLAPGDDAAEARWVTIEKLAEYELSNSLQVRLRQMGVI